MQLYDDVCRGSSLWRSSSAWLGFARAHSSTRVGSVIVDQSAARASWSHYDAPRAMEPAVEAVLGGRLECDSQQRDRAACAHPPGAECSDFLHSMRNRVRSISFAQSLAAFGIPLVHDGTWMATRRP
jgi:hypothetical protein